jgi:hypothetical protein
MTKDLKPHSWWQTIPGILTAIAAVLTAVTGLIVAINHSDNSKSISAANQPSTTREFQVADLSGRWQGFHGIYYIIEQQGDKIKWEEYDNANTLMAWGSGKIIGKQIKVEYDGSEGLGDGILEISSDGRQISGTVTARNTDHRASIALSR